MLLDEAKRRKEFEAKKNKEEMRKKQEQTQ